MPKNPLYVGEIRVNNRINQKIYPIIDVSTTPVAKTSDYTVVAADLDQTFTNTSAGGTVVLTLPSVSVSKSKCLRVQVTAAQIVRCLPVTGEKIFLGGDGVATKYLNIAAVIGNYANLYCDGTYWLVTSYSGVVTKEA